MPWMVCAYLSYTPYIISNTTDTIWSQDIRHISSYVLEKCLSTLFVARQLAKITALRKDSVKVWDHRVQIVGRKRFFVELEIVKTYQINYGKIVYWIFPLAQKKAFTYNTSKVYHFTSGGRSSNFWLLCQKITRRMRSYDMCTNYLCYIY